MKISPGFDLGVGQDRTGQSKQSQGGNISPIWGEARTVPIEMKICMASNLADVITCAKFQDDIFSGYNFIGDGISHFSIDFCMGLIAVQRYGAAYDRLVFSPLTFRSHALVSCDLVHQLAYTGILGTQYASRLDSCIVLRVYQRWSHESYAGLYCELIWK